MRIELFRRYRDGYTPGVFSLEGTLFYTLERPWIPSPDHRGGLNMESCIPEGEYSMSKYTSTRFPDTWILANPKLDVHKILPNQVKGRSLVLVHPGNFVKDVQGCIAVGLATAADRRIVLRSKEAMEVLRKILGKKPHTLVIGAYDEHPVGDSVHNEDSSGTPTPADSGGEGGAP